LPVTSLVTVFPLEWILTPMWRASRFATVTGVSRRNDQKRMGRTGRNRLRGGAGEGSEGKEEDGGFWEHDERDRFREDNEGDWL